MKRSLSVLLVVAMVAALFTMGMTVSAAGTNAFDKETFRVAATSILYDNIDNTGGSSGNAFNYAANYGTGRNDKGDTVVYDNIDFGSKGASKVTVNFGFHNPEKYSETKFAVYIDNPYGDPIANWTVKKGETKGSEIVNHVEMTADCAVAPGKHDVYFMATNEASGSFDYIYFTEASTKVAATKTVANVLTYPKLNPFSTDTSNKDVALKVIPSTIILDQINTKDQGGSGKSIAYMEANGVGYSSKDDLVVFPNCDFGKKGAKKVTINFAYNKADTTAQIGIFIDNPYKDAPDATITVKPTGGWDLTKAQPFSADISVGAGIHTVFVRFMDGNSGSFGNVVFTEGDKDLTVAAATTKAATTPDLVVLPIAAAVASLAGIVVSKRRK